MVEGDLGTDINSGLRCAVRLSSNGRTFFSGEETAPQNCHRRFDTPQHRFRPQMFLPSLSPKCTSPESRSCSTFLIVQRHRDNWEYSGEPRLLPPEPYSSCFD